MLKASHSQMKRAALSAESTKSTPPLHFGWFATMPTGAPLDAREAGDELAREELLHLDERALVDDRVDERASCRRACSRPAGRSPRAVARRGLGRAAAASAGGSSRQLRGMKPK